MLLYCFEDREELVTAVLRTVGDQLGQVVEALLPPGRSKPGAILGAMAPLLEEGEQDPRLSRQCVAAVARRHV